VAAFLLFTEGFMSENAVITAEASTAPAPETSTPVFSSFAEERASWTPAQQAEWDRSGKEPEKTPAPAEAPAESTEKTEPSVPQGRTEAAPEPAEEDQELPEGDTAEARRARNRMFAKLRHDRAALKAQVDLLERQRKETPARNTESAPAPKVEPKAETGKFQFREPNDNETWGEYQTARDEAHAEFIENRIVSKFEQKKAQETAKEREDRLVDEFDKNIESVKAENPDYDQMETVVFAAIKTAGAKHIAQAIIESANPRLVVHFGKNPKEFSEILAMTPHRALLAIGKAESRLEKSPDPKPITVTRAAPPAERVNAASGPAKDPIEEAEAMFDKTGDHKYLTLMNELKDKRDREARRR
jgi:hypothetical protein